MQASLALLGCSAAAIAAARGGQCSKMLWGSAAALLGANIPYTYAVVMPTNEAIFKQVRSELKCMAAWHEFSPCTLHVMLKD